MAKKENLTVANVGPISEANVSFGDLTIIVGPQASGKSIFLQTLKLAIDRNHVHDTFQYNGMYLSNEPEGFLGAFFGRGMGGMLRAPQSPTVKWAGKERGLSELTKRASGPGSTIGTAKERLFYIPAQRVVSLPSGNTRPFGSFEYGDPYVLRYFADRIHGLLQNEFGSRTELFPATNRLNSNLRDPISEHFFGGAKLELETKDFRRTLTLKVEGLTEGLPFLAWSAGQREFVPLLLGLYWLCPGGAVSRRDDIEWVIIEEPEMGLHPRAILALLLNVVELMRRGYKVVISTHSTVLLDLVWAVKNIQRFDGTEGDVRHLFDTRSNPTTKALGEKLLNSEAKVFFFERGKAVQEISSLDPSSDINEVSTWGGLSSFALASGDVVAEVVARHELKKLKGNK